MKKIISAGALALGLTIALAPSASASVPEFPSVPGCVDPSVTGGDVSAPWTDIETDCGLAVAGDERAFVSFVEDYADYLNAQLTHLAASVAAQADEISEQQETINNQRAKIKRLKARIRALRD